MREAGVDQWLSSDDKLEQGFVGTVIQGRRRDDELKVLGLDSVYVYIWQRPACTSRNVERRRQCLGDSKYRKPW